jgi:hypothetical protein
MTIDAMCEAVFNVCLTAAGGWFCFVYVPCFVLALVSGDSEWLYRLGSTE